MCCLDLDQQALKACARLFPCTLHKRNSAHSTKGLERLQLLARLYVLRRCIEISPSCERPFLPVIELTQAERLQMQGRT
jgi:hypothetical protein